MKRSSLILMIVFAVLGRIAAFAAQSLHDGLSAPATPTRHPLPANQNLSLSVQWERSPLLYPGR